MSNYKLTENGLAKCNICGKEVKPLGFNSHYRSKHGNFKMPNGAWNKGLTKETDERVRKHGNAISKAMKKSTYKGLGRVTSEATKRKLSNARLRYLKENPDKVPYLLNHHSLGESYPEKYFREVLEKAGISFEREKREGNYSLDFVIKNIDLEIDGEQHYLDERIVKSDRKRNKLLKEKGYEIIRIRWSQYQKLSKENKEKFIENLLIKLGSVA